MRTPQTIFVAALIAGIRTGVCQNMCYPEPNLLIDDRTEVQRDGGVLRYTLSDFQHLPLTTDQMESCLLQSGRMNIDRLSTNTGDDVTFYPDVTRHFNGTATNTELTCLFDFLGVRGSYFDMIILEQHCSDRVFLVAATRDDKTISQGCDPTFPPGTIFSSFRQRVQIRLTVFWDPDKLQDYRLRFVVRSVALPSVSALRAGFASSTLGYVQLPNSQDPNHKLSNLCTDSHIQIKTSTNHSIMASLVHISISVQGTISKYSCQDFVRLYVGDFPLEENIAWTACGADAPEPVLTDAKSVILQYKSYGVYYNKGFRLLVSFHERTRKPSLLSNGKWNCSVPHYPDFRPHLSCNLRTQCDSGEDEEDCLYTACHGNGFAIRGRCYFVKHWPHQSVFDWKETDDRCRSEGGHLASLPTIKEWDNVMYALQRDSLYFANRVAVGLKLNRTGMPHMYRNLLYWSDGSMATFALSTFMLNGFGGFAPTYYEPVCGYLLESLGQHVGLSTCRFVYPDSMYYMCEVPWNPYNQTVDNSTLEDQIYTIQMPIPQNGNITQFSAVTCDNGHLTHSLLQMDAGSHCRRNDMQKSNKQGDTTSSIPECMTSNLTSCMTPLPSLYLCESGLESVVYTLVCDHIKQCTDGSDEDFCVYPNCSETAGLKQCSNKQCVPADRWCDEFENCLDLSDETNCSNTVRDFDDTDLFIRRTLSPPLRLDFDGRGKAMETSILEDKFQVSNESRCPETHFFCANQVYCLPVYVRCNGVEDCPGKEDEAGCDSYTCPGLYRCHGASICLHVTHLCDGWPQCPRHDDERFCNLTCPKVCSCQGHVFTCSGVFPVHEYRELRYLDASDSGLTIQSLRDNLLLIHLSLARCNLTSVQGLALPNLLHLDLTDNLLTSIGVSDLQGVLNLRGLILAGNPLVSVFSYSSSPQIVHGSLRTLDISRAPIRELDFDSLDQLKKLTFLNMSYCGVERLKRNELNSLQNLQVLDLSGSPVKYFTSQMFAGLTQLRNIRADNYKLCCPDLLPEDYNPANCLAPSSEVSSCEQLLQADIYRVCLSLLAVLALACNLTSFVARTFIYTGSNKAGFGVFVTHLCVADFMMGVYLAVVGVADRMYQGSYLWQDVRWRGSAVCKMAGFLSLLSSEVSAFLICLITLDRFLVLRFPFSQMHFHRTSAQVASMGAWVLGLVLAGVPLLPVTSQWEFYGQTGICIPLPITRTEFKGHGYSFGVMIVLNFVLFLLIAAGQVSVYLAIRAGSISKADNSTRRSQDLTIARRLITVVVSDFLCWFPIGLLGLLATQGVPIPGEVNVGVAILVLPLNSALNPFLYTVSMVLERRERARESKILEQLEREVQRGKIAPA